MFPSQSVWNVQCDTRTCDGNSPPLCRRGDRIPGGSQETPSGHDFSPILHGGGPSFTTATLPLERSAGTCLLFTLTVMISIDLLATRQPSPTLRPLPFPSQKPLMERRTFVGASVATLCSAAT